jgi:hypothetical protein
MFMFGDPSGTRAELRKHVPVSNLGICAQRRRSRQRYTQPTCAHRQSCMPNSYVHLTVRTIHLRAGTWRALIKVEASARSTKHPLKLVAAWLGLLDKYAPALVTVGHRTVVMQLHAMLISTPLHELVPEVHLHLQHSTVCDMVSMRIVEKG